MVPRILLAVLCLCWPIAAIAAEPPASANPRQAAAKKLADAQAALRNAITALAEADKAKAAATDEAARLAAQQAVKQATEKLEQARRELARQNTEALNAAAQAAAVRRFGPAGLPDRDNADPRDPLERFALLTPGGPLVIEASLTIDGQPFRIAREKLIDVLVAEADKDKDGKATWNEALASSRFTLGRIRLADDRQREAYAQSFDGNKDGLVDRNEARQFVAQVFQGPSFVVGGPPGFGGGIVVANGRVVSSGASQVDVRTLLDTDANGTLDEPEIAAASERLKSRDGDDNDLLESEEISGRPVAYARPAPYVGQPDQRAVLLGPTARAQPLMAALKEVYKNNQDQIEGFTAMPVLFGALDKNNSGRLEVDEVLGLNDVTPHVALSVDLRATGQGTGVKLKSPADQIIRIREESANAIVLALPGAKVSLAANRTTLPAANYDQTAASMIARFDQDKNGYLEKKEMPGNLAQQLELWDADEDGKAFAPEIAASYTRMLAPQSSQIVVSIASQDNSLFSDLDVSRDSRLSLREMRAAPERIKGLDKDQDGRLTAREIPATIVATFGLGNAGYGGYSAPPLTRGSSPAASSAPEWFTRMDRNGDGDLTLKEFLGRQSDFRKLDSNADGFIEPEEARTAGATE
jgi:Ca2+-binding EF-hand superfamily protein